MNAALALWSVVEVQQPGMSWAWSHGHPMLAFAGVWTWRNRNAPTGLKNVLDCVDGTKALPSSFIQTS
jgi:hypothetical protein